MKKIRFVFLVFLAIFIYFIVSYQISLLNTNFYVEPAENESLVILQSEAFKSNSTNINDYFEEGIIPIYPNLFYKISNYLFEDSLLSLRFLNVMLYWIVILSSFLIAYFKTKQIFFSSSLALLIYGISEHSVYFYMARPDGTFIGFGILSLLLFNLRINNIYIKLFGVGLLSSFSVLSKQSGLFFVILILLSLFIDIVFNLKNTNKIKNFFAYFLSVLVILVISFYLNPVSYESFKIGLNLYGSDFSISHVYLQSVDLFIHYWWLILFVFFILFELYKISNIKVFMTYLSFWVFTILISVKLFSNNAAHFNNYIFITILFYFTALNNYKYLSFKKPYYILLTCGIIFSFINFDNFSILIPLEERIGRIEKNGQLRNNNIFKYINENEGEYLTSRADNLLYFNKKKITYEASVFDNVIMMNNNILLNETLKNKVDDVNYKLLNNYYTGIITGINGLMEVNFPLLKKNYKVLYTENIESGDWPHNIKLWIKK